MTGPGVEPGPADERGRRPDAADPVRKDPAVLRKETGPPAADPSAAAPPPTRPPLPEPPSWFRPDVDAEGNRPTDVLPRRRPPLSEQPTTALPRPAARPPQAYRPAGSQPSHPPAPPPRYVYPADRQGPPPTESGYGNARPLQRDEPAGYFQPPVDPAYPDGFPGNASRPPQYRGTHLPPYQEPLAGPGAGNEPAGTTAPTDPTVPTDPTRAHAGVRTPRKITVTRVAAMRSRELTLRGVDMFHRATTADGADRSGLAHLTYAQMANYACDAALAVALANTLFLVKPEEGPGRVLLYLLITVAPFALVAPLIGPFLDRLQTGRRLALAVSMGGRGLLAVPMIFTFSGADASWALYPCALGSLVLSKSFGVLKASLTPRVLPEEITLVATNSRLTVFGLIAGGVAGAIAAGLTWLFGSPGALVFTALLGFGGAYLCLKIPAWVESTEGEVPVHLTPVATRNAPAELTTAIRVTLWANSSIRIETGFLAMFIAFVVMKEYSTESGFYKLMLLGLVGGAAGVGGFLGNALGAKLPLRSPETISTIGVVATVVTTLGAAVFPGLATAAIVGFIGSTASSLAKVCLDSVIQRDLAEVSRASAFGRSETALQLAWVFGGVVGLLIGGLLNLSHNPVYVIGFGTVTVLVALGLVQTWLARSGRSLVPPITMPWRRSARKPGRTPKPARGGDGTYTTRISVAEGDDSPTVPHREPRAAGSPRPPDPTLEMPVQKPGRRRGRRGDHDS